MKSKVVEMIYIFIFIVAFNMLVILGKLIFTSKSYEKVLLANIFTSNVVLALVLFSSSMHSEMILDVALVYVIINFISLIAFLKFFVYRKNADIL